MSANRANELMAVLYSKIRGLSSCQEGALLIYWCGVDTISKPIAEEDIEVLYDCLQSIGNSPHLNLILSSGGGLVTAAYRVALLLREFTNNLTVIIPYKARSSATLICLSANKLLMGALSELSPLDAHIMAASSASPSTATQNAPKLISAEEIAAISNLARDWFQVETEDFRMQMLSLMFQRMFPTTLSSFYRANLAIRKFALQLLQYQILHKNEGEIAVIIDSLVKGYHDHATPITRKEARALGLQVEDLPFTEDKALREVSRQVNKTLLLLSAIHKPKTSAIFDGLIMAENYVALHMTTQEEENEQIANNSRGYSVPRSGWYLLSEIDWLVE